MKNKNLQYDFSGYATKVDIKCSDGRIIRKGSFKHQDGVKVPLVWHHMKNSPGNVLGYAILEHRDDGVYAYGVFNQTQSGQEAKMLVEHGDIEALSIFANNLEERNKNVTKGDIKELSLVMAGANPGAKIDNVVIAHGDGSEEIDLEEAIIYTDEKITHGEGDGNGELEHEKATGGKTIKEVFDTFTDEQKDVVYAMIAHALGEDGSGDAEHSNGEGLEHMKKNLFDNKDQQTENTKTLTHDQFKVILEDAAKCGSLREAILSHATEYGIDNIDVLFPDARTLSQDPDWLKREDDWVNGVLAAVNKSPFSRVKSVIADMDVDTARAKGYITGNEKKEVYMKAAKRVTTPTTVYAKQKLDRDDIIDVVDFDIVAMVRFQLRTILNEELALALLIGDGREIDDQDKINEENIRPIWKEDPLYAVQELLTSKTDYKKIIKEIAFSDENYKGSGSAVFYTTSKHKINMLWVEDNNGRKLYDSEAMLCATLGVSKIVVVPQIEGKTREVNGKTRELIGIKVNLKDYNMGADKGGQIATFDDFDIDFNQYKYLMETRCSGALTKPKSAQIYEFETVG